MIQQCLLLIFILTACNLQFGTPPPLPTPDVPQIEFQEPANNARVVEGTELTISLAAFDSGTGVARVELLVDDIVFSQALPEVSAAVPVFTAEMNWLAEGVGFHSLTAIAYRSDGTAGRPTTISILVVSDDA